MIATILPERKKGRSSAPTAPSISLAPLANEALIKHQLRALKAAGITKLVVPSGNPDLHNYWCSHRNEGVEICFDAGGQSEPLLVLAPQARPGWELRSFTQFHARSGAPLTIAVAAADRRALGIYAVSPSASEYSNLALLHNVGLGRSNPHAQTFAITDGSIRIDSVADYLEATRIALAELGENDHNLRRIADTLWTDDLVFIAPTAHITGDVLLGRNCSVGAGATIVGPVVLGEGTMICRNAHVETSVTWAGAAVGANARVTDSLLTECFTIAPGAVFDHCVGMEIDSNKGLPFRPGSHAIEYSPRGLAVGTS